VTNSSRVKEHGVAKRSPLAEKLDEIRGRIAKACVKANREVGEVILIAVTKTAAPEQMREILQLGVGDLGEGRVQVLTQRVAQINEFYQRNLARGDMPMPPRLRWHMIGHLQRNKVKQVLPMVDVIHSVDSLRLAEELDAQAEKLGKKQPVMLQVNASEELQKFGVAVGASVHLAEQIDTMPNLQLVGLMSMAALDAKPDEARKTFARTREIFEEMRWHKIGGAHLRHLSMGMSQDFEPAILEGATMLRIGTALFGGHVQDDLSDEGAE
jgi:pyridoxal phosphate enzyme (YggS family)